MTLARIGELVRTHCGLSFEGGREPLLAEGVKTRIARRGLGSPEEYLGALTRDGERPETLIARWLPTVVKGGAMGCLGLAHVSGVGIAAKAWTGVLQVAVIGVIEMLRRLRLLPAYPELALAELARPPVFGGELRVGTIRPLENPE